MLLTRLIKNVLSKDGAPAVALVSPDADRPSVLNVGGNSKSIPLPAHYEGWRHALLDIAPGPDVDVVCDARELQGFTAAQFDAVYCSHNLEHFHPHDVPKVLAGFLNVLKPDGFVEIRVPNITAVLKWVVEQKKELDDVLYISAAGPISAHDVIYGWGKQIEESGVDFFAHKRGFSQMSLNASLQKAGFSKVWTQVSEEHYELRALAFRFGPTAAQQAAFSL